MSFDAELQGITKSYGDVRANQGVTLKIRSGTIHALVGENGAGKSTAMKILFGSIQPDSGTICFGQTQVTRWNPQEAFKHGIGMVHQHFMLAGPETVHDNLVLGVERTRFGLRQRKKEREQIEDLMKSTGLEVPLDVAVDKLPIGLQSRCEILKVLYRKARFLILDEPTAVLTPQETESFLETLRLLRKTGNTVLIVTHKLKEVMAVADEATILRAGKTVATRKIKDTSPEELSELMVGRHLQMPRISKRDFSKEHSQIRLALKTPSLSLELRAGEIAGIAGVEGNGQEELIEALLHPARVKPYQYELLNQNARAYRPNNIRKLPMAVIPADRHKEGLILSLNLTENLRLGRRQSSKKGFSHFEETTPQERELLQTYDVRPNQPELAAHALSGGNQQKVIVARELGDLPTESVVLAIHPTRGVDVGAIEFIHSKLLHAASRGAAVLLISSELDELMALSHRIGVLYRGAIRSWFEGPPYDESAIGLVMLTGGNSGKALQ